MGILKINETYDPEISPFIKFLFELNEKNVSYPNLAANVETLYKICSEQKYKERGYVIEKLFDTPSPLLRDPTDVYKRQALGLPMKIPRAISCVKKRTKFVTTFGMKFLTE